MLIILIKLLWSIAIVFLLLGGVYFSTKLNWPQLRINKIKKSLFKKNNSNISTIQNLTLSLAAKIGVGSIAGIAIAIYFGGPGSLFWMWIVCIIISINSYCETFLGAIFQNKINNLYEGGPVYYIEKADNKKVLSKIYAICVILTYILGFMTIQSNTVVISFNNFISLNKCIIALILAIISFISIKNGLFIITKITSIIVPLIGIIYVSISVFIFINNVDIIPKIFLTIINNAFNVKSFGTGCITSFVIGIQRGVFCTESGIGTGAIASSSIKVKNITAYSIAQIIGVYFTIFIICSSTALIILSSNYQKINFNNLNGIELVQYSINYHLGNIGNIILLIMIFLLAYSTIVAGYYYGESNLRYLAGKDKSKSFIVFKIITSVIIFVGGIVDATILWNLVDLLISVLSIINMYSIFSLRNIILDNYEK